MGDQFLFGDDNVLGRRRRRRLVIIGIEDRSELEVMTIVMVVKPMMTTMTRSTLVSDGKSSMCWVASSGSSMPDMMAFRLVVERFTMETYEIDQRG